MNIQRFLDQYPCFYQGDPTLRVLLQAPGEMSLLPTNMSLRYPHPEAFRALDREYIQCLRYASLFGFFAEYLDFYPDLEGDDELMCRRLAHYKAEQELLHQRLTQLCAQAEDYRRSFEAKYLDYKPYFPGIKPPTSAPDPGWLPPFFGSLPG